MKYLILLIAALWVGLCGLLNGEQIVNADPKYTLQLPDGFVAIEGFVSPPDANITHAYVYGQPSADEIPIQLFVELLRGPISRERMRLQDFPAGFQGKLHEFDWQGLQIDGIEVPEEIEGIKLLTYNIQVPLQRRALQLRLFGPESRRDELQALAKEILLGLQGTSNWSTAARPQPKDEAQVRTQLITIFAVVGIAGLVALLVISRFAPKGTVLAIAVLLYVATWNIEPTTRLMHGLVGVFRLVGFAGILLGIFDLVRQRKTRPRAKQQALDMPPIRNLPDGAAPPDESQGK